MGPPPGPPTPPPARAGAPRPPRAQPRIPPRRVEAARATGSGAPGPEGSEGPRRPEPRDRRIAETRLLGSLAALAALGAVLLTVVWVLALIRGPSTPTAPGDRDQTPAISGAERGESILPREREPVVETSEVFASRDPFGALRPGRNRPAGQGGPSQPSWARVIELVAARRGGAQVRIDDRSFTVDEGQRFAEHFKLLYVRSDCAAILFGDDQFSICQGERILK